jgi:polar amino acid transport system permease protein
MSGYHVDWSAVLSGQPLGWLMHGVLVTLELTLLASLLASVAALILLALRLSPIRALQRLSQAVVSVFRNTPLAVQLLFWYFGAVPCLPAPLRSWLNDSHSLGWLSFPSMELCVASWSLGLFSAAFIAEELRAGVRAVAAGQMEAARSQGFSSWQALQLIILPQAVRHAWQPLIGQYLNLLKNSPLTMSIALAELMYQTNQIESFNFHGIEAYAVASVIYLLLGLLISVLLRHLGPAPLPGRRV